jgi:hypothetical protein
MSTGPDSIVSKLRIHGLWTNPNAHSEVPQGVTLEQADNIVLSRDSIAESRRGMNFYGVSPGGVAQTRAIFDFKDTLILHDTNNTLKYDANNNGSLWTAYLNGPYTAAGSRMRSAQSNKNLYLTTGLGVLKLENPTSQPKEAGVPQALGGTAVVTDISGFMSTNTNVAYRIVWGYRDQNANLILSAPSDRIIATNTTGGSRNVQLTFFIPNAITTNYFFQLYRSAGSATAADQPNDELQLVYESAPTDAQIAAGLITVVDQQPDNLRGAFIYTAPSEETILLANNQPPYAETITTFNGHMFYGNTRNKHSLIFTLISVGGTVGIQVGDTLTFTNAEGGSTVISGQVSENAAAGQFIVSMAATPAENIAATARSIVNVLNTVSPTLAAYYISGFDDLPGQMKIERLTLSPYAVYINTSRPTAFRPDIPVSGVVYGNTTRNEVLPNRVYFSKKQEPEAVPLGYYLDVGSADQPILALDSLRDGVIILKRDGVYRISGNDPGSFQLSLIDDTVSILAADSAVKLNNNIYFYSSQGIVAASDTGVEIVSRPIEDIVIALSSSIFPNFAEQTFGVGYESLREYKLYTITTDTDTVSTQCFVYNFLTKEWTRDTKPATAGIVKQEDDKLYIGGPAPYETDNYIFQERKTLTSNDKADEQYPVSITGATGLQLVLSSTSKLQPGYTIVQAAGSAIIKQVLTDFVVLVDRLQPWSLGPATVYRPIYTNIFINPIDAGDPGNMKHWADLGLLFDKTDFTTIEVATYSDITRGESPQILYARSTLGGWGTFPWGSQPWGSGNASEGYMRTSIPKESMRCHWVQLRISLAEAFTGFTLEGVQVTYSKMSRRIKGSGRGGV